MTYRDLINARQACKQGYIRCSEAYRASRNAQRLVRFLKEMEFRAERESDFLEIMYKAAARDWEAQRKKK